MSYGQLVTRFTTGGHDIFITCPGLSVHTFCGTGDENIIPPVVQRVITTYCQVWYSELAHLNKLDTFKAVNKLFNFEKLGCCLIIKWLHLFFRKYYWLLEA